MMSHIELASPSLPRLPDPDFWIGRRVFLTGHTSFHGAWMALWLEHLGANVMGFSLPPTQVPNLYEQARVAAALASHFIDLRDRETMEILLEPLEFDIALHMALPSPSYSDEGHSLAESTASILQTLRRLPMLQAIIVASEHQDHPTASSAADAVQALMDSHEMTFEAAGIPLGHARLGKLVGGGDYGMNSLIPNILRAYDAQTTLILQTPELFLPWQHVLDALNGILVYAEHLVAQADIADRTLSFAADAAHAPMTKGTFASVTQKALNAPQGWHPYKDSFEQNAAGSTQDAPPPPAAMTFINQLSPRQSIAWALHWYLQLSRGADLKAICLSQIATYERLVRKG